MLAAPVPADDANRLACLRCYNILDTPADRLFDDLVRLAARVSGAPIALISLVDEARRWFKAKVGIDAIQTPREISFCGHAVAARARLVVEDATQDPRFHDNPLVTGPPHIRFYAGVPLQTPAGAILWTLCVIGDVARTIGEEQLDSLGMLANQVVAALELRRAMRELTVAHEAVTARADQSSRMMGAVTHELRQPMNGVLGLTEVMLSGPLDGEQRRLLLVIEASARALVEVVDDVLDMAKLEAGKLELVSAPVDIGHLVEVVSELLGPRALQKRLALRVVSASAGPEVLGDAGRIRQIVTNLVGNAIKFTDAGHVTITLKTGEAGGVVPIEIEVADSGPGMAPEQVARLFGAFVQVGSAAKEKGTGLGLWLSRKLARSMGGDIAVDSRPGEGSKFTFRLVLPRCVGERPVPRAEPPPSRVPEAALKKKVLVVDDNTVNQFVARAMLEKLGCAVDTADNGSKALDAARDTEFDLILMDCQMPVMDGYAATRELLKRAGRRVPIVGLTGATLAEERAACVSAGMDDVLTKPVRVADLQGALERLVPVGHAG